MKFTAQLSPIRKRSGLHPKSRPDPRAKKLLPALAGFDEITFTVET
ncbi:hypothetical protein HMPREF3039_00186 [Akkermansia sp. KLE1798]|nr:hypothetical protein HMPREF3039_00186 [Akkermansia sp. KLE1798]KZA05441.1 hypothetical protein HMPREF1326_00848 [Akkermansia sp. KLE1605]